MNQQRDATKPTWMAGFEVRLGVGDPLHACNANPQPGQVQCAHPSDINRNGNPDPAGANTFFADEGVFPGGTNRPAGVSRGTTGLELHSFISSFDTTTKRLFFPECLLLFCIIWCCFP